MGIKEEIILRSFLNREMWRKYGNSLQEYLEPKSPYHKILQTIQEEYTKEDFREFTSILDLEASFLAKYPDQIKKAEEEYSYIFKRLAEQESAISPERMEEAIQSLDFAQRRRKAANLLLLPDFSAVEKEVSELLSREGKETKQSSPEVTNSLKELYDKTVSVSGLRWRLQCLNKSLGSLRRGDFGFIFKRPETGGTTFLASEVSFMSQHLTDGETIFWFNNEEQGEKVKLRIACALLGKTTRQIFENLEESQKEFDKYGHNIKVIDNAQLHRREVENLLGQTSSVALVVFDQLDKVKGFADDRNDLELGGIYQWAREIAKRFGPVIAVSQCGASGENKRWLTMDDVANAKTSKQAEADWILGIGAVYDSGIANARFLNICKNKLSGDSDTDPSLRHGQFEVMIRPEIARYEDIVKWAK